MYDEYLNISINDGKAPKTELQEYLDLPTEKVADPLAWWWARQKQFPVLLRMAMDYLSAPGMLSPCRCASLLIC